MTSLRREGDVFVLDLGDDDNRFNPQTLTEIADSIAEVVAAPAPRAMVTTASGKIWSNGLDLDWLGAHPDHIQDTVDQLHTVFADLLGAGVPTVAAINGHCFAAGAMFALAHDQIIMRRDRGYWCVPEADLGLPFTPGMQEILLARLPRRTAHHAMISARRYGGEQALAAGIVDDVRSEHEVLPAAVARAAEQAGKNPEVLAKIKSQLHRQTLDTLRTPQPR